MRTVKLSPSTVLAMITNSLQANKVIATGVTRKGVISNKVSQRDANMPDGSVVTFNGYSTDLLNANRLNNDPEVKELMSKVVAQRAEGISNSEEATELSNKVFAIVETPKSACKGDKALVTASDAVNRETGEIYEYLLNYKVEAIEATNHNATAIAVNSDILSMLSSVPATAQTTGETI